MIHHGDCLDIMPTLDAESIDSIVTDPPYGLEFMGKEWDKLDAGLPQENVWKGRRGRGGSSIGNDDSGPASRHHVAFGGAKSGFKRCAICGKRAFSGSPCKCDEPQWVIEYPDGAPSSSLRMQRWHEAWAREAFRVAKPSAYLLAFGGTRTVHRLACAIEDAGWIIRDLLVWGYASGFPKSKASLKPAWEPIVMARKPGPLRELAIDACRIAAADGTETARPKSLVADTPVGMGKGLEMGGNGSPLGRWPANIVLTDPIFDGGWDGVVGGGEQSGGGNPARRIAQPGNGVTMGDGWETDYETGLEPFDQSGTYSRFFLIPKAARSDREPVLGGVAKQPSGQLVTSGEHRMGRSADEGAHTRLPTARANHHPTVKPTDLMRHLVRLVTPPGGIVLDPFFGSGTTALAAEMEGFGWVGIEREEEYVRIAEARLNGTQRGLGLGK